MGEYLLSMQEALSSQPNEQTTLSMSMLNLAFLPNLPTHIANVMSYVFSCCKASR